MNALLEKEKQQKEIENVFMLEGKRLFVKEKTHVCKQGECIDSVFVVESGNVEVLKETDDGKELVISVSGKGDIVGDVPLFSDDNQSFSIRALTDSVICEISKKEIEAKILAERDYAVKIFKVLSVYHKKLQSKLRDVMVYGKKGALYSTLIRLANSYGIEDGEKIQIDVKITNQLIANLCGMTREATNRLLGELKDLGVITSEKKSFITILDMSYLKKEIHCENCPIEICRIN